MIAAALLVLLAQGPGPTGLSLPAFRLHVLASEDLDPDRLRPLAAPGVVLWLSTRSNTLRESTLENLARFAEAWVQLRPPLTDDQARALFRAPRAGAYFSLEHSRGVGLHRLGPRPLAVLASGPLDPGQARRLRALRPSLVSWEVSSPDLLSWALFRQLPGRKLIRPGPADPPAPEAAVECRLAPWPAGPTWWVDARAKAPSAPPCGQGLRARVRPGVSDGQLLRLYRLDPAVELELEVGTDERAAIDAGQLLARLRSASPQVP